MELDSRFLESYVQKLLRGLGEVENGGAKDSKTEADLDENNQRVEGFNVFAKVSPE
jgi:hypothetical protein